MILDKTIILDTVCNYFDVTEDDIRSQDRRQDYVKARHILMYFLRRYTLMGLYSIGDYLHKDHSSIVHGVKAIIIQYEVNKIYKMHLDEIDKILNGKHNFIEKIYDEPIFMENDFYKN
jgi:chromosomal replication initiator protein